MIASIQLERWLQCIARVLAPPSGRWGLFSALSLAAAWPYLAQAGAFNAFRDAQVLWLYEDAARRSVIDFAQFPFWNPDYCGGLPALGTPQSRFFSPTFLLTLLWGTTRAEGLTVFVMLLVAHWGAYAYFRDRGAHVVGAALAAPAFALMGLFACAPFLGWFGFMGFALLPWALLGTRRAARGELRGAVLVSGAAAWMVGFGGTYVAPISLIVCAFEVLSLAISRRFRLHWLTLAIGAELALGLGAARLWPIAEELSRAPRAIAGASSNSLGDLLNLLFGGWPAFSGERWYLVGVPAGAVSLVALVRRRALTVMAAAATWIWVAQGYGVQPSAFGWLRALPVFSMLRNPERFLVPAALLIALGAAWAVGDLAARARRDGARSRKWLLLQASAMAALLLNAGLLSWNFHLAASARELTSPPHEVKRAFHQARGNRWMAASFGPMSRGSLACWEAYPLPQSPLLRGDLQEEAWLLDGSAGTVRERQWTPQHLDFALKLHRPTTLLINQNHRVGWRSSVGSVRHNEGLLAVDLPAGTYDLTVRFLPKSGWGGLLVSSLAGLLAVLFASQRKWNNVSRKGLVLAGALPLVLGAAVATGISEPRFEMKGAVGPEGETLLAQAPPADSTPANVHFEGGVTLQAASVMYRPHDDRVRIELDWSRLANTNPRLGVFVHIEPGALKRITADHLRLSDSIALEEIPPGHLGRDIMLIDVPKSKRDQPWNVWVGLWEMRGDGHRIAVEDSSGLPVDANRVLVGSLRIPPPSDRSQ